MGVFSFHVGSGFGSAKSRLQKTLLKHFGVPAGEVATAGRQFPITPRMDIQSAIEDLLRNRPETKLLGVLSPNHHEPPAPADIVAGPFPINQGLLQQDEIDIGELLLAPGGRFGLRSVQVEIGIPAGERGAQFSQELFRNLSSLAATESLRCWQQPSRCSYSTNTSAWHVFCNHP